MTEDVKESIAFVLVCVVVLVSSVVLIRLLAV